MTTARRWPPNARLLPALRLRRFRPALFAAIRAPLPTAPACVAQLFSPATRRCPLATSRLNPQIPENLVVFVRVRFALHLIQSPSVVDHLQVINNARALDQMKSEPYTDEDRSEEHTSELQSPDHLVCRLLL